MSVVCGTQETSASDNEPAQRARTMWKPSSFFFALFISTPRPSFIERGSSKFPFRVSRVKFRRRATSWCWLPRARKFGFSHATCSRDSSDGDSGCWCVVIFDARRRSYGPGPSSSCTRRDKGLASCFCASRACSECPRFERASQRFDHSTDQSNRSAFRRSDFRFI